jgi:beta-glucosidase
MPGKTARILIMDRVQEVLSKLTVNEKISLLSGSGVWQTEDFSDRGLPSALMHDGPHGLRKLDNTASISLGSHGARSVCFPCACSTANSWDETLLMELGERLGEIARAEKVDILLGPGVNIKRSPLCGRNFEYFSEDPLLSGMLGAAWVRGLQSKGVGASAKHFCANNQETLRTNNSSVVDERTLREIYLKPFEIVVREANP